MNSTSKLMRNTLALAGGSILLRAVGLCFQAYLAVNVGAELLGIFGLVSSVYIVFSTVSISGVRFSVTRLVSEEEGLGNPYPRTLLRFSFLYSFLFGFLSMLLMYATGSSLAHFWIGNDGAELPLKIMAISMPFIAFGAIFDGYFTAKQKVFRLVFAQLINQLVRISITVYALKFIEGAKNHPCDILSSATLFGEAIYTLFLFILYFADVFGKKPSGPSPQIKSRLLKTALPLAVSAYTRTGLSSLGHVIIPRGLKKAGFAASGAFTTYGIIHQMAFPVIMFPAALLSALGEILIPRLTYAQVNKKTTGICYMVNRALRIGLIFSIGVCGIMLFYSELLSQSIYKNNDAAYYIRLFAPLLPIMYCDNVTDGCLKGLGQQLHSMLFNILEAVLNIILLLLLLPQFAISGYIFTVYIKEIFNAVLSIRRLNKVTSVDFPISVILCTLGSSALAKLITDITIPSNVFTVVPCYMLFYCTLLYIVNAVSRDDIRWILKRE